MKTKITPRNSRGFLRNKFACTLAIMFVSIPESVMTQGTPTPAPVMNGKIAFTRLRNGDVNPEIYVMDPDGSHQTNLTNNPLGGRRSWWHGDRGPAWSPDGARIAFARQGVAGDPQNYEIYVMDADGSNETRLTNDPNYDFSPAWSPDGKKIAFASMRTGFLQIYVMDEDGSNPIPLTNSSTGDSEPVWSPDGARIAFVRFMPFGSGFSSEIYVMDAGGSNQTRLTNNPGRWNEFPAWSPDGAKIAFDSNRANTFAIYVMNADGSNQIALSNSPGLDLSPEWSPDGTKIVFTGYGDGRQAIYVMDADGSNQVRLTSNLTSNDGGPRWQRLPAPPFGTPTPTPTETPGPRQRQ